MDVGNVPSVEMYMSVGVIALTLYDYLLVFDDEIRYVWKGRKTGIFYLYIMNRFLLVGCQIWEIGYLVSQDESLSETACRVGYYIMALSTAFFLFSSDVFIGLRIYAITSRNKILAAYFGLLALGRLALLLVMTLAIPLVASDPNALPPNVFTRCGLVKYFRLQAIPAYIGTAFELSAFTIIVWCMYRLNRALKVSALISTIVTEATIYVFVMVAVQAYSIIGSTVSQKVLYLGCGLFSPILTLRFAISLKKAADPEGGQKWQLKHFSTIRFPPSPAPDAGGSADLESVEIDPSVRSYKVGH